VTCTRPGCGGTIQDGYCDTCGLAAVTPSAPSVPSGSAGTASGPFSGSPSSRSRSRRTSGRSARGRLGAGLVEIPPVAYRDPASAILANPRVPENKRFCSGCDQPVGRDRDGRAGIDSDEPIYGTVGYFRGFQGHFKDSLPDAVPVLAQHESAFSATFSPEVEVVGANAGGTVQALAVPSPSEVVAGLPLVERADPAAGYLATFAGLSPEQRIAALTLAVSGDPSIPEPVTESAETRLAPVRARLTWYHGLRNLALAADARDTFNAVYSELPGEAAPKLALAFAAEAAGDPATAGHYFRLVWAAGRSCVSAGQGAPVSGDDLRQADGRLGQLGVDDLRREQLTVEILRAALDWCGTGQPTGKSPILGCEPNARALRFGLERSYRALARLTPDEDRRVELVDMANAIRPRTLT
jgi:Protein kinase G tetratricopeptide repeat/Protein kinase G rubredoxin domain